MVRFVIISKTYQDWDTDNIGISKDSTVNSNAPTFNYGANPLMDIGTGFPTGSDYWHSVLEIQMPDEEDILGFGRITKVELQLYQEDYPAGANWIAVIIKEIADIWDEGNKVGAVGECSWDDAQLTIPWKAGSGIVISRDAAPDDAEIAEVIDAVFASPATNDTFITFDLTPALEMSDKKSFVLFWVEKNAGGQQVSYSTKDDSAAKRPKLVVTYRSYPPDGFTEDADKLRVIPNPDNPVEPKLTWGGVKADDFLQYKLYRSTNPITAIDGFKSAITDVSIANDWFKISGDHTLAFPVGSTFKVTGSTGNDGRWTVTAVAFAGGKTQIDVAEDVTDATADGDIHHGIWTSTDPAIEEFIDVSTLTNGTIYYYRLIAEDQDNHEDDALLSATVFFTKPDVTTATLSPSGAQNVGTSTTITVVSPQNIKRLFVDWKDGTESWYEYEIVGLSKTASHIYTEHSGAALTPDVRIQDEFGFWSDIEAAGNTITPGDTTPTAKLQTNTNKEQVGAEVTLNAVLSQPKGANVTIDKYEFSRFEPATIDEAAIVLADGGNSPTSFKTTLTGGLSTIYNGMWVRFTSGALSGEQRAVTGFTPGTNIITVSPGFSGTPAPGDNLLVTKYFDNGSDPIYTFPTTGFTVGVKVATVRITTSTSLQDTDTVSYELETGTPTELEFSIDTRVHEVPHILGFDKQSKAPLESDGVEYQFKMSRRAERITIHGTSHHPNMETDINLIRNAWLNDTFIRVRIKSEMETKEVLYDGKLEADVSLGQAFDNMINWSFPMIVFTRTEV